MIELTFEKDGFVREQEGPEHKLSHFHCVLSNGQHVWQDDGRCEGLAWNRLAKYLEGNSLNIDEFWLEFKSNKKRLFVKPPAISWARGLVASLGGSNFSCHSIGIWDGNHFTRAYYSSPDLEVREFYISKIDWDLPNLIVRKEWPNNELKTVDS